jgi:Phage capsid protein
MAGPVSDTYKLAYSRLVMLAVQQLQSRFESFMTYHADLKGRQMQILDLVEPTTAIVDGVRGGSTPNIEQNHEPVWVKPRQIEWGKLIEKEDYIKALTDYESPYVQSGAAAIIRGRDLVFATQLFGNRIIGLDGTTTAALTVTGRYVADTVGSADGLTRAGMNTRKMNRAIRLLRAQYVELQYEQLCGLFNAQGSEELYNDILTINTDYRKMAVLDEATRTVLRVGAVEFMTYESLPDVTVAQGAADANDYGSMIFCKSGMHYGDFDPLQTTVEPNPSLKYRLHPYMENWWGATRSEDAKFVLVANYKTPAGPNG